MSKLYQGACRISSPFGTRTLGSDNRFHKGIDYVGIDSKNIIAPTNGKIISSQIITNKSNLTWEWGNYVKMDDLNDFWLFFCHLSKRCITVGQTVSKGQLIGIEGETGYAFGSHLHFEVRRKLDNVSIDPEEYFKILDEWERKHEVKEMTVDEAKRIIQEKAKLDDNTMKYLEFYRYSEPLLIKLAEAIK